MIDFNTDMIMSASGENGAVRMTIEENGEFVLSYVMLANIARELAGLLNQAADDAYNSIV